jgi:fatty-acyl-CoA synthase
MNAEETEVAMAVDITLGGWFEERVKLTPNRRCLTFEGETWSYATMLERIDHVAAALREGGVRHGDRVAFLGLNHPAFFETLFAAARLGAIFVPLNFRLTPPELSFIINDAGVHTIVADDMLRAAIDSVRDELPCQRYLASESAAEGWTTLAPARAEAESAAGAPALREPVDPDEVALIMYTSGTTGRPKGAMLTHANLWWNNTTALLLTDLLENDVSLVVAPLFHIGGLNVTTLQAWMKGAENVLHRSFDPGKFLEDIARYDVTVAFAVPAMLLFVSQHPDFADADLTTVRSFVCGGAPVPEAPIKLFIGRGIQVNQGYGLTETAPCVTFLTPEHALAKVGSAGRAPMFIDVRLLDSDDNVVTEPQARGEICVRGPNVMKGYWNRPEATRAAIDPEGWFHTGDVGYFDADGFLFVADRIKDMVITGGENVYPAEVEGILYTHPAVADVAVIGLPDARWGEAVTAVVVLQGDAELTLEELREFATESLARFKLPSRLEIVDVLPRNPAGKVLKFDLRDRFG